MIYILTGVYNFLGKLTPFAKYGDKLYTTRLNTPLGRSNAESLEPFDRDGERFGITINFKSGNRESFFEKSVIIFKDKKEMDEFVKVAKLWDDEKIDLDRFHWIYRKMNNGDIMYKQELIDIIRGEYDSFNFTEKPKWIDQKNDQKHIYIEKAKMV